MRKIFGFKIQVFQAVHNDKGFHIQPAKWLGKLDILVHNSNKVSVTLYA